MTDPALCYEERKTLANPLKKEKLAFVQQKMKNLLPEAQMKKLDRAMKLNFGKLKDVMVQIEVAIKTGTTKEKLAEAMTKPLFKDLTDLIMCKDETFQKRLERIREMKPNQ